MRNIVNFMKLNSINNKYLFKGVSIVDLQSFINKLSIDTKIVRIYQDIPNLTEDEQFPLNKTKYVNKINRRINKFETGNDCFIIAREEHDPLYSKTCDEIFYGKEDIKLSNNILLIGYFHDIDWQAVIIFNDISLEKYFFEFIDNKSKIKEETDIKVFFD